MVIRSSNRKIVKNPLQFWEGRYQIDVDDLEDKAYDPRNMVLILCNPHNPVEEFGYRKSWKKWPRFAIVMACLS